MGRQSRYILGMRVDATSYADATRQVLDWVRQGDGHMVCCANVHMAMECFDDDDYRQMVNSSDLVTADGVPLVWALRGLGETDAGRVYGPDLTRAVLQAAEESGIAVGFYGGSGETLLKLMEVVARAHPRLVIRFAWAPPFHPLSAAEDQRVIAAIRESGAKVLFVGLGCPKQERWIVAHRTRIPAVMLGVGAAFDFLAGVKPQAPTVLQRAGCEWLFRLAVEPTRLWKRYLHNNPRFVMHCGAQLLRARREAVR